MGIAFLNFDIFIMKCSLESIIRVIIRTLTMVMIQQETQRDTTKYLPIVTVLFVQE